MNYPRPGEPIVPHLLRPLVLERHPSGVPNDRDNDLIARDELGADAWKRLPPEACRRVSLLVVDRVQTRLRALPQPIRDTPAAQSRSGARPADRAADDQHAPPRRRAAADEPWTVGRYLSIRRFGGRALVDLLAAFEARAGVLLPNLTNVGLTDDRALKRLLLTIAHRLPIAEHQLELNGKPGGRSSDVLDLASLLKSAAQLGHDSRSG